MIIDGDSGKGEQALNPFDAVGLESFMRINEKMTKTNSKDSIRFYNHPQR